MTPTRRRPMGQAEFIALMAMLSATIAFSIDAMLPALPEMGADLSPLDPDRVSLVVTSFVAGMGLGTLVAGPLSDAFGRKPVMICGAVIYCTAAAWAGLSYELDALLLARFVQGLGASGPRVVALAVIRDLYKGREMARLVSLVMVVFTLVPVIAPTLGKYITDFGGWHGIFLAFIVFSTISAIWLALRLDEPLPRENRRPFRLRGLWEAFREMWAIPMVRLSMLAQTLCFGMLFSMLSSTQLIFDQAFGKADTFHLWFGAIAAISGTSGLINANLVRRFGMRPIIHVMFKISAVVCLANVAIWLLPIDMGWRFWVFLIWQTTLFFQAGMVIGNLNALAMEPMGHMAGSAASILAALATIGGAILGTLTSLIFNGTALPLAIALSLMSILCVLLLNRMRREERVIVPAPTSEV